MALQTTALVKKAQPRVAAHGVARTETHKFTAGQTSVNEHGMVYTPSALFRQLGRAARASARAPRSASHACSGL